MSRGYLQLVLNLLELCLERCVIPMKLVLLSDSLAEDFEICFLPLYNAL
jgi:hypothetical protein